MKENMFKRHQSYFLNTEKVICFLKDLFVHVQKTISKYLFFVQMLVGKFLISTTKIFS